MREVLFKAKRVKNGEWIEGSLIDLDITISFRRIKERVHCQSDF